MEQAQRGLICITVICIKIYVNKMYISSHIHTHTEMGDTLKKIFSIYINKCHIHIGVFAYLHGIRLKLIQSTARLFMYVYIWYTENLLPAMLPEFFPFLQNMPKIKAKNWLIFSEKKLKKKTKVNA